MGMYDNQQATDGPPRNTFPTLNQLPVVLLSTYFVRFPMFLHLDASIIKQLIANVSFLEAIFIVSFELMLLACLNKTILVSVFHYNRGQF